MNDISLLGDCCYCHVKEATVVEHWPYRFPVPKESQKGWGCLQCGLSLDGLVIVFCEPCATRLEQRPSLAEQWHKTPTVVMGAPHHNHRARVARAALVPHQHNPKKHPEFEDVTA